MDEVLVEDCSFKGNHCKEFGGSITLLTVKNIVIDQCLFEDNVSDILAGAVYISNRDLEITKVVLTNSVFRNNTAK